MTLQQLKYAVEIASCDSFGIAARKLFITQPSLSKSIRELEEELHIQLFTRTSRGISVTHDGTAFLGYARQVLEQIDLLERRFLQPASTRPRFSVTTQHYAFAVNAFVELVQTSGHEEYDFALRETKTFEILDDVRTMKSEIGILYINTFNEHVLGKHMRDGNLSFHPLFSTSPHVFISRNNPLANKDQVTLSELEPFPYLHFEQGEYNSFYFSEELLSTMTHRKSITVSDRATLFNLLIGLNGFTISSGIISTDLNGMDIIAVPLAADNQMTVGWIQRADIAPSPLAKRYTDALERFVGPVRSPQDSAR